MSTSVIEVDIPFAQTANVTEDSLDVELTDGRSISVPLAWYPRLLHATAQERADWRLIGRGEAIHWRQLDEDLSVEGLILGRRSLERPESFRKWLAARTA